MPTPKKSEFLEVRLPYATKQAFMARCLADGVTASQAVRTFIDQTLAQTRAARSSATPMRLVAAACAALALGAIAAPSLARPSLPDAFARIDADHSGGVSLAEFSHAASLEVAVSAGSLRLTPISPGPFLPARDDIVRQAFIRIDADRDGEISFAEFRRAYGR